MTVSTPKRFEIHGGVETVSATSFAEDVRHGLCSKPKKLAPKYFYDELGSALFEAITHLPEYYLTRAENELLEKNAVDIVGALDGSFDLLELGSGSATKTRHLIRAALKRHGTLRYRPIDISPAVLLTSSRALLDEYSGLSIEAYAGDYLTLLDGHLQRSSRTLAIFLGSNIGNYEPREARALLRALRRVLKSGDALLLGVDLKKPIDRLELAYDDPAGVTAAFNKIVLARINRELGGSFDLRSFEHEAHYDAVRGAVDMFLVSTAMQKVRIRKLDLQVSFTEFESIHTESSYKYDVEDIERIGADTGFELKRCWIDSGVDYALSLLSVS
jgi:L-histidine N-alpha-methyltransferase